MSIPGWATIASFPRRTVLHPIAAAVWLPMLCAAWACVGPGPEVLAVPEAPAAPPGEVRVRLVFGADADLDLYVTGPSLETVYFANESTREGGRLEADRRCDAPAPRVETVRFPAAASGTYRVGVDFPGRCTSGVERVPYLLAVEAPGQAPETQRGEAVFGVFETVAWELRLPD